MKTYKISNYIIVLLCTLIFIIISCAGTEEIHKNISHKELCDIIAGNWAGVHIRYKSIDDFKQNCYNISKYNTKMELVRNIRSIISDGHFYIGMFLEDTKPNNIDIKFIPLVLTYDIDDNAVIAESTDELRDKGLSEGNFILELNGLSIIYYINTIMNMLPQSTYHESKEKAYRMLLNNIWQPENSLYFDLGLYDTDKPLLIKYFDTKTKTVHEIDVEFQSLFNYENKDELFANLNNYISIQRKYAVSLENECTSNNEYAVLKNIDGEKWLVYHPYSFFYDTSTKDLVLENLDCYLKFINDADRFLLDLRDTVGGTFEPVSIMLDLIGVDKGTTLSGKAWYDYMYYDYGTFDIYPKKRNYLDTVPEDVPVYIWSNSMCGSACDIFLSIVKSDMNDNIKILGKPSAGRVLAIRPANFEDYSLTLPFITLFNEYGIALEGRTILPDYYFDVKAESYQTPDSILEELINYISRHNL